MYHQSQFEKYAAQLPDAKQAADFLAVVETFQFDSEGLCSGGEMQALAGTNVAALREDFEAKHMQFLDIAVLMKLTGQSDAQE